MSDSNGGGGYGGWIVLLLIGAGVWFFFIQPNQQKDYKDDRIERVLDRDKQGPDDRTKTEVKKGSRVSTTVRMAVDEGPRKIDLTRCPSDFQQAYIKHIYSCSELPPLLEKYDGVGGAVTAVLEGLADKFEGDKEWKRITKSISDTSREVEVVALKYGVQKRL